MLVQKAKAKAWTETETLLYTLFLCQRCSKHLILTGFTYVLRDVSVCSSFLLLLPTSVVHLAFHLALANKLRTPKPFVSLQNARQPYMSPSVAFAAATLASSFSVSSWPRLWQTTFSPSLNWPRNDQAGTSTKECGWMVVSGERV